MMDYDITATLGPASADAETWAAMLAAGATAFRLNTSHLSLPDLEAWLRRYRGFAPVPLVLDLQGSKWRLGDFPGLSLVEGDSIELVYAARTVTPGELPVPHVDFFRGLTGADEIVLNDAKSRLVVESARAQSARARVTVGGAISARKGITVRGSGLRLEALSEKDQAIFDRTRALDFVRYAVSYVRDGVEMDRYRDWFGSAERLIAKLERGTAMLDAATISASAGAVWVCRGDLGAELGLRAMAEHVAAFTAQLPEMTIPCVMAGQVLEHMTQQPAPTRSEVCYLYDALQRGYSGFVLSDETAVGRYPVEACRAAALWRGGGSIG